MPTLITSSPEAQWELRTVGMHAAAAQTLSFDGVVTADFKGFGGCFNELGWKALAHLGDNARNEVLAALFSSSGCDFNYCRLPIGASDYSESWYSHNETPGDFGMERFSIARDHVHLIPYIEAARAIHGEDFYLFASPWSPPTWMKAPQAYNFGALIWEPKYRAAYADYFVRFLRAYADVGLRIDAVHIQNEPNSDQKFPSCKWTGAKMRDFIRDDLGPAFKRAGIDTEIWAGTIERGDFNAWAGTILSDPKAAAFVKGLGFQWAGKAGVQRTKQAFPDVPLIQTENECGDGTNTWAYAHYVFDLIQHYLSNGAEAYVYWNMVLEPRGMSTWGWEQNAMVTVDPDRCVATFNPEFYVMKHFAGFVRPGAQVLRSVGPLAGNSLAFRNPNGQFVCVIQNASETARAVNVARPDGGSINLVLDAKSISTLVF
jgi:glucosylceramidase